jgi:DNA-binding transcriptional LysR family regulator
MKRVGGLTGEIFDLKDDLRIRSLKTFLTLVETGSFSKTAERLGITQGTVSNHITSLEQYFDAELFYKGERAREGGTLTQEGLKVLHGVREIIDTLNRTKDEVERLKGAVAGKLRIATSTIPGEHLLPKFIAKFKAEYPNVDVEMDLSDSEKSLEKLSAKESDLAAVGSLIGYEADVESFPIAEEQLVLIVSPEHEMASKGAVDPKELINYQLITREKTSGTRKETERILENVGVSLGELKTIELGSTEAVITAVSEGYGISVISSIAAEKAALSKLVKAIPLKTEETTRKLYIVRRVHESYPVLIETFWDFMKTRIGEKK